ncbi:hypothetical protein EMPS_05174 [Entomortierella parvispora]|uniref:DUF4238 domain-containing protein n=1 Tax=Entomortierella parvispora TaxID=205924 RepID=A0A9P3H9U1_9FUNG|nr:hypothetical protein EMPS_05174 [Entomortierella parvispora]
MAKSQFHHYIPRFILKTFSDDFTLDSTDCKYFASISTEDKGDGKGKGKGNRKGKVKGRGKVKGASSKSNKSNRGTAQSNNHYIKVYQVQSRTTVLTDIGRAFGVVNLYREEAEEDCMKFERLLSVFEGESSTFIRRIWTGEDLSLTRAQLERMKKFLIIMMYRSESRRDQYNKEDYDIEVAISARKHASHHSIARIRDIWFKNLQWLIETPLSDLMKEYNKVLEMVMTRPLTDQGDLKWPIHICELKEFGVMAENYMCIWEAEEGTEFILSEGGFGAWEGDKGVKFHNIFVVSPRYAIVLVLRSYMFGMTFGSLRKSYFGEKLHANPETVYVKGHPPEDFTAESHFTPSDIFKYKRIKVPKSDVFFVNCIFLDARDKHLTYRSPISMLKSLKYYDMVKEERFTFQHDYTALKRELFADLNRTHRPEER